MEIFEHKKRFDEIIKKYNLSEEKKAQEIVDYLIKTQKIKVEEFATLFAMKNEDAQLFLSFINKGLEFKKKNIDKI